MHSKSNSSVSNELSPKQLRLLNTLRRLWVEHVMWTRSFLVSTTFDLKDLNYVTKRLLRNPADFANVLRPLYGSQKAMKFENLLTEHLLIAGKLVDAAKAGDTKAAAEQRRKWYDNADDIAAFLSEINPYWSKKTWQSMLYSHLRMTEDEAMQLLTGQYAASIDQYDSIQDQALIMADNMAYGIIKQFNIQ